MKFAHLASRVAVGGVATALATAGLVGATGTPAQAVVATTNYTCSVPGVLTGTVDVAVNVPLIPPTAPAGFPVPANLLSFTSSLTVPASLQSQLDTFGVNGAKSGDFSTQFGDVSGPAPVVWDTKVPPAAPGDPTVYTGKGANAAFVLPKAGTYSVTMPKQFSLTPTSNGSALPVNATCTSAAPATLASITLSKQASKVKAHAPKSADKGDVVPVKGKVTNDYSKTGGPEATGKVIVKDGKKTVGKGKIKHGKFVVKLKGLAVGSHSLSVAYKGDDFTDKGVSKKLKLQVKA